MKQKGILNQHNYYFTDPDIFGYKNEAYKNLTTELEKMSYKYKEPDGLGGGGGEIIQQIIAYLSIHDLWVGVITGLVVNRIEKLLSMLNKWHIRNKNPDNKLRPIVNIYIHLKSDKRNSFYISFRLDKKYSKKEIENSINKATKND